MIKTANQACGYWLTTKFIVYIKKKKKEKRRQTYCIYNAITYSLNVISVHVINGHSLRSGNIEIGNVLPISCCVNGYDRSSNTSYDMSNVEIYRYILVWFIIYEQCMWAHANHFYICRHKRCPVVDRTREWFFFFFSEIFFSLLFRILSICKVKKEVLLQVD